MIPDPKSNIAGAKVTTIYNAILSMFFRMLARGYFYIENDLEIENESENYRKAMRDDEFNGAYYLSEKYKNSFSEIGDYYSDMDPLSNWMVVGFWLRRNMDGSISELWKGLRMGMFLYDKEWLQNEEKDWES